MANLKCALYGESFAARIRVLQASLVRWLPMLRTARPRNSSPALLSNASTFTLLTSANLSIPYRRTQ